MSYNRRQEDKKRQRYKPKQDKGLRKRFKTNDGAVYCDDMLCGEWDDGEFVPSRDLLEQSPEFHLEVDTYVRSA